MTAVHQFAAALVPRDAISGHMLEIDRTLREAGVETAMWCRHIHADLRSRARPYEEFQSHRSDPSVHLLYHSAIGSPVADFVRNRPEPKILDYHNITPPRFFAGWEPALALELATGRRQLAELAGVTGTAFADSAFNAAELRTLGYHDVGVVPILLDTATFEHAVDPQALGRLRASGRGAKWLFVGRIAPNKAQHDIVAAFAAYRRLHDPDARLWLVGSTSSIGYSTTLERYVAALGLDDAVTITGSVPDAVLGAHYRAADVFVCLSEHEGFCVPVLEAMYHGLPVVAFGATAVPETAGDAALVLGSKGPAVVAAAVAQVMAEPTLRDGLIAAGRERLAAFALPVARAALLDALAPVLRASR